MSGFHIATVCADCDPPVVAISTGDGSRCPRCGQIETWSRRTTTSIDEGRDGSLARRILRETAVRSDGDARLLAELARRLLDRAGRDGEADLHVKALEEELADLRDLADLVSDADISALPPELVAVRQRWIAESHARDVVEEGVGTATSAAACPHCAAGEPSVWDDVLAHYAHPDGAKLKMCHSPWRARCRRCSADVAIGTPVDAEFCAQHGGEVPR